MAEKRDPEAEWNRGFKAGLSKGLKTARELIADGFNPAAMDVILEISVAVIDGIDMTGDVQEQIEVLKSTLVATEKVKEEIEVLKAGVH